MNQTLDRLVAKPPTILGLEYKLSKGAHDIQSSQSVAQHRLQQNLHAKDSSKTAPSSPVSIQPAYSWPWHIFRTCIGSRAVHLRGQSHHLRCCKSRRFHNMDVGTLPWTALNTGMLQFIHAVLAWGFRGRSAHKGGFGTVCLCMSDVHCSHTFKKMILDRRAASFESTGIFANVWASGHIM